MSSKKKKSAKSDDAGLSRLRDFAGNPYIKSYFDELGVDGGSGVVRVTSESQIELLEMKLKEATEKSSR